MGITPVSNEAFVVIGTCEETRKSLGITVDPNGRSLRFVWAFRIDKEKARREGFGTRKACGGISYDDNFPGCPYCGAKQFYICDNCNSVNCYHGQKHITCPSCGMQGKIQTVESINLRGGGY